MHGDMLRIKPMAWLVRFLLFQLDLRYLFLLYLMMCLLKNILSFRPIEAMLRDLNTCRRCSQAQNCTVFHKAVEEGDHGSSGLGTFFDEMTVHMTSSYVKYFAEWFKLVCLEGKELEEKKNQWEIWCIGSWEREKMGRCFSGMELVFDGHEFVNGGFFRHTFVRCEEHPSVTSLQDVPISCGDRIIVSEDPAGPVALSAGE